MLRKIPAALDVADSQTAEGPAPVPEALPQRWHMVGHIFLSKGKHAVRVEGV